MTIVISHLVKSYNGKVVLKDYSAVIDTNQITCILGPSGCGKTTLLHLMMGLIRPDSGSLSGIPEKKSAVFQEDRLCEPFSAIANIRLTAPKSCPERTMEEHLSRVGLQGSMNVPVRELSGGMRRRVAIVRAVLATSDILFMDEPFKGLDAETKQTVIRYVKEQTAGKTVILVTHDPDEVEAVGGNRLYLEG